MPEDPTFYILKSPTYLPADLAPLLLGRIVKNYASPLADFVPFDPSAYLCSSTPHVSVALRNVSAVLSSSTDNGLKARLGDIAQFAAKAENSSELNFSSSRIRSIRVQQHTKLFNRMVEHEEIETTVKKWLAPGGSPAYLVVGLCIWENASVSEETASGREFSVKATVPVGTIATGALGAPLTSIGDVSVQAALKTSAKSYLSAETEGKHIFALECRSVYKTIFSAFVRDPLKLSSGNTRFPPSKAFGSAGSPDTSKQEEEKGDSSGELGIDEEPQWTHVLDDIEDGPEIGIIEADGLQFAFEDSDQ